MGTDVLMNLFISFILFLGSIAMYFVIHFLKEKFGVENLRGIQEEFSTIKELARTAVLFVQQVFEGMDGPAKYAKAIEQLNGLLADYGFEYTEEQLKAIIESTLLELKAEFGEQWHKQIDPPKFQ